MAGEEGMTPQVDPWLAGTQDHAPAPARLDLHEEDRLPWLESAEDDYGHQGPNNGHVAGVVLGGLGLLALAVGGIWWGTHHNGPATPADGASVAAPAGAIKEAPKDPGGKTFAGTGDSSFAVSQGQTRPAQLASDAAAKPADTKPADTKPAAAALPSAGPAASTTPAATKPAETGGVGVQVGAYTSQATAEAGWNKLVQHSDALAGLKHRISEGQADIGTVYRLQAITADTASANALCDKLKAAGVACHIKH